MVHDLVHILYFGIPQQISGRIYVSELLFGRYSWSSWLSDIFGTLQTYQNVLVLPYLNNTHIRRSAKLSGVLRRYFVTLLDQTIFD